MKTSYFFAILLISSLFAGCAGTNPDHASLPWARPATWENTPAGMGGLPGMNQGGGAR